MRLIIHFAEFSKLLQAGRACEKKTQWLQSFARISASLLSTPAQEHETSRRLICFGTRKCSSLLVKDRFKRLGPGFGLTNIKFGVGTILTVEEKFAFLRHWASFMGARAAQRCGKSKAADDNNQYHPVSLSPNNTMERKLAAQAMNARRTTDVACCPVSIQRWAGYIPWVKTLVQRCCQPKIDYHQDQANIRPNVTSITAILLTTPYISQQINRRN